MSKGGASNVYDWTTAPAGAPAMKTAASVKTGSNVDYTAAKTRSVLQAIWFALKDLAVEDNGSILSILKEARDLVVRPIKSVAEREWEIAARQFLNQIYRTLKEVLATGLRAGMETIGIASALGGDVYVAMHKLASSLANTPEVDKLLTGPNAGTTSTGDIFDDEANMARACAKLKKRKKGGRFPKMSSDMMEFASDCVYEGYMTFP